MEHIRISYSLSPCYAGHITYAIFRLYSIYQYCDRKIYDEAYVETDYYCSDDNILEISRIFYRDFSLLRQEYFVICIKFAGIFAYAFKGIC